MALWGEGVKVGGFSRLLRHMKKAMETYRINPKEMGQLEKIKAKFSSDSELLFNKIIVTIHTSEFSQCTQF